jgi:hypothetical protein
MESGCWLENSATIPAAPLYATPRHLEALPGGGRERDVWVQQLMLFDPAIGTSKAITSGVSNNVEASLCQ